jgi:hypothetical protein
VPVLLLPALGATSPAAICAPEALDSGAATAPLSLAAGVFVHANASATASAHAVNGLVNAAGNGAVMSEA